MKKLLPALIAIAAIAPTACRHNTAPTPKLSWSAENIAVDSGPAMYRQSFTLTGDLRGVKRLAFNQFARHMQLTDSADTLIEIVPGYYAVASRRFADATGKDTIQFDIETRGVIRSICYGPDGAHLVMTDDSTLGLDIDRADMTACRAGYTNNADDDKMPYADKFYAINENLANAGTAPYSAIPSFSDVKLTGGESIVVPAEAIFIDTPGTGEAYSISVSDNTMTVRAERRQWPRLRRRIATVFGHDTVTLPNAEITDAPSLPYRGLMIDIARNYQTPAELHRVIDLMADYGLNVLHFHAVDDEAWRLEIPALPELTEAGSRRGYTPGSNGTFLPQIFAGDGNPLSDKGTANGYFTRADFISLLKHADSLGIRIIPEIESPGHGRAAIEAMKLRARRSGDNSWLIAESADIDTSRYTSAQSFHDNIMNPALDGTYRLMEAFADEMKSAYAEAGVDLPAIHIGGDEVPRGAWSGSPAVKRLMEEKGLISEKEVHAFFVDSVARIYAAKGIKISGWQEIALRHSKDYNERVRPEVYSVNCWSTLPSQGQGGVIADIAAAGYPIVLSNVNHFYLDMTYSYHPYERGLSWGGTVDEFDALHGYPKQLCPFPGANLIGIQGQVFAETIRSPQGLEHMLLPKMLGLAERAWNTDSTYTDAQFNAMIEREIPRWQNAGYAYHLRQPGIALIDGRFIAFNSPYRSAEIHYTLDGTNPDASSPTIESGGRLDLENLDSRPAQVRAVLILGPEKSVVSILNI